MKYGSHNPSPRAAGLGGPYLGARSDHTFYWGLCTSAGLEQGTDWDLLHARQVSADVPLESQFQSYRMQSGPYPGLTDQLLVLLRIVDGSHQPEPKECK